MVDGQVVDGGQGLRVLGAEDILMQRPCLLVERERRREVPPRAQVAPEASPQREGRGVSFAQGLARERQLFVDELVGLGIAAKRAEHITEVSLRREDRRVIGTGVRRPPIDKCLGQLVG